MITTSIKKAKENKLFYVVATGTIYHPLLKKCLILQRSKTEIVHPLSWGVVGGKLEWGDFSEDTMTRMNGDVPNWEGACEKLLIREAYEESGLTVSDPRYLSSVGFIRPDGIPVMCLQFAVKWEKGEVIIPSEFEAYAWVDNESVKKYETMKGIEEGILQTLNHYS